MDRLESETRHNHPSFGVINLNRVTGSTGLGKGVPLFGSSVDHGNFISLTIKVAEAITKQTTGEMRTFPKEQLIEVYLSEAQFAEFISRWNQGEGTCCTIVSRAEVGAKLVGVDGPPRVSKSARETFEGVADQAISNVKSDLAGLADEIEKLCEGRLTKKNADRLHMVLRTMRENPSQNLKFAQQMINEGMEKTMARARLEMEAAARGVINRMGLGAMADKVAGLLPMPDLDAKNEP